MNDSFAQMREFIMATEALTCQPREPVMPVPVTEAVAPKRNTALVEALQQVIFRLRAFMESSDGEFAFGVETGMQRAADMIENAIKHHGDNGG